MLEPAIAAQLASDDDPGLWEVATNAILGEAATLGQDSHEDVFAQVGCCRHWVRPHQSRWSADGGFAAPFGYDKTTTGWSFSALPGLEWSAYLGLASRLATWASSSGDRLGRRSARQMW